jgi:hypothetical protein
MKKYRIWYKLTSYAYIDIEVKNKEAAEKFAKDFNNENCEAIECPDVVWDLDEIEELNNEN